MVAKEEEVYLEEARPFVCARAQAAAAMKAAYLEGVDLEAEKRDADRRRTEASANRVVLRRYAICEIDRTNGADA